MKKLKTVSAEDLIWAESFRPNPKPPKHKRKARQGRLTGVDLKRQNEAIILRDGDVCGVCGCRPPEGNHFTPHHNLYPERYDIIREKISACPQCHMNLHEYRVWENGGYVKLENKFACQEWVRQRIMEFKLTTDC